MYPAALHKILIQTVDSSQVFERWFLRKQPKTINKLTKSWDTIRIKYMERDCLKKVYNCLSIVVVTDNCI